MSYAMVRAASDASVATTPVSPNAASSTACAHTRIRSSTPGAVRRSRCHVVSGRFGPGVRPVIAYTSAAPSRAAIASASTAERRSVHATSGPRGRRSASSGTPVSAIPATPTAATRAAPVASTVSRTTDSAVATSASAGPSSGGVGRLATATRVPSGRTAPALTALVPTSTPTRSTGSGPGVAVTPSR